MKKILITILISIAGIAHAQDTTKNTKVIQEVTVGLIASGVTWVTFPAGEVPFSFGTGLVANVTAITPKTCHLLMYGFADNSVRSLNSYLLKNNWDVYALGIKPLNTRDVYLGFGLEKMIQISDKFSVFEFVEVGTDFCVGTSVSIGILLSLQNKLKK